MWRYATARQYPILIPLCFSQITFKNGRTQIAKGGYLKLKPCSDVDEKTQSKFIGCVRKNTAVSTLYKKQPNSFMSFASTKPIVGSTTVQEVQCTYDNILLPVDPMIDCTVL